MTAPTITRRHCEPPSTTHRAQGASRRHGRAPVERHVAASAAAPPSRRQECQHGAAGSGAVSAARRRLPPGRKRPHRRPYAENASSRGLRTASRERAAATKERWPSATPPRARRHDRPGARSASAAPGRAARHRRQRRRECRATATAPRVEAIAPTTTRGMRETPYTTHRAKRASRHRGRVAAERHAAASAAARPSRC